LIANLEGLDWMIVPKDMSHKDELDPVCRYYTKLLERGGNYPALGLDYTGLLEWVVGDMLDTPFGGMAELGRKFDQPNGRVLWIKPVDAGTMYPTLNESFPAVQYYQGYEVVSFPAFAMSRITWSPHQYLFREGWGVAPPEKIYFALDMLNKGDKYYADLLINVPTNGILDLGDMDADSAREWIESFHTAVNDTNTSYKIPVLYEHNNKVEFLPFGKAPNDLMFDRIINKYDALVAGGYGLTLGDIGLETASSSGETLAGSIRGERKTRKTGFARVKNKWMYFVNSFLPDTIQFILIDQDDEVSVAMGRARLASATAFNLLQTNGNFSAQEVRTQLIKDGLVDVTMPDKLPPDAKPVVPQSNAKQPGALGKPVPPSQGGHGEIKKSTVAFTPKKRTMNKVVNDLLDQIYPKVKEVYENASDDDFFYVRSLVNESFFDGDALEIQPIIEASMNGKTLIEFKPNKRDLAEELKTLIGNKNLNLINIDKYVEEFIDNINNKLNNFVGKSVGVMLSEVLSQEVVDKGNHLDDNYVIEEVKSRIQNSLNDLVNLHISNEFEAILEKMENEND
jgi:hypothetical protein